MPFTAEAATLFDVVSPLRHIVGECPTWDERSQELLWSSIIDGRIYALDPATGRQHHWQFEAPVGSFGLCRSGRLVVALRTKIVLFDPASGRAEDLAAVTHAVPEMRFNDGKVGPDGAFWVGSMDDRPVKGPIAKLYRIDAGGQVEVFTDGLHIANGLAWNAAGTTMYFSDSRGPWVDVCDFDAKTGTAAKRRRFLDLTAEIGRPDGATCDSDDCYWSAGPSGSRINRFSPTGELLDFYELANFRPTMPCFGGADLSTLYVTSLTQNLTAEQITENPLAGTVLAFRPGARGVPTHRFAD
ncbi:MAG: SMP-30/gluconolactonase/LRE family protein [Devosia sp.]